MKTTHFFVAAILGLTTLVACSKTPNDNITGIVLQAHDANRMMDSMHAMMNRMEAMTMTMDPDNDFAAMMMMHHEGAINMAGIEMSAGANDSLKRFAQKVIKDQKMEMMAFESILSTLSVDTMDMAYMDEQTATMEKTAKAADVQIITGDIDNDFATLMMVHHQSAIDDASGYLHHGSNAQLRVIANNIITAQTMEIKELADWLKANRR